MGNVGKYTNRPMDPTRPAALGTLQGINISHLGKRNIIDSKCHFGGIFLGDMLVPWRVIFVRHLYELVSKPPITAVYFGLNSRPPTSLKLTAKGPENGWLEHELSIWCLADFQGRTVGYGEVIF